MEAVDVLRDQRAALSEVCLQRRQRLVRGVRLSALAHGAPPQVPGPDLTRHLLERGEGRQVLRAVVLGADAPVAPFAAERRDAALCGDPRAREPYDASAARAVQDRVHAHGTLGGWTIAQRSAIWGLVG